MTKEASKGVKAAETAENKSEVTPEQTPKKEQKVRESVYTAGEFAANARKIFGTRAECVVAALKAAGKSECTISEAKEIVQKFLKREVQ